MSDYQMICSAPSAITDTACTTGTKALSLVPVAFNVSSLDPNQLGEAFAAGFSIMAGAMIVIAFFRLIIKPIFGKSS